MTSASVVFWLIAGLLAFGLRRTAFWAGLLSSTYSLLVWIVDPLTEALRVDWFSLVLFWLVLLGVVTTLVRGEEPPAEPDSRNAEGPI